MIGITGTTGRLGKEIVKILPEAIPIGRSIPNEKYSILLHCAAPRANNNEAIKEFTNFNIELRKYCDRYNPKIINVGSCWQILRGNSYTTEYAMLKRQQTEMFPEATHIIPYWIYGEERGFIYDLTQSILKNKNINTAGYWDRDFVCVTDVAKDIVKAIDLDNTMYASCTQQLIRPFLLAHHYNIKVEPKEPYIWTLVDYPLQFVPNSKYISVYEWIEQKTGIKKFI